MGSGIPLVNSAGKTVEKKRTTDNLKKELAPHLPRQRDSPVEGGREEKQRIGRADSVNTYMNFIACVYSVL